MRRPKNCQTLLIFWRVLDMDSIHELPKIQFQNFIYSSNSSFLYFPKKKPHYI